MGRGHIQHRVMKRKDGEIAQVEGAYDGIPRELCIGALCAFYNKDGGRCDASQTPIKVDVEPCTQNDGPVRSVERA